MDDKDCTVWKREPLINPVTQRVLKEDGPMYKRIKRQCVDINKKTCRQWKDNESINPITKRGITVEGDVYADFKDNCKKRRNRQDSSSSYNSSASASSYTTVSSSDSDSSDEPSFDDDDFDAVTVDKLVVNPEFVSDTRPVVLKPILKNQIKKKSILKNAIIDQPMPTLQQGGGDGVVQPRLRNQLFFNPTFRRYTENIVVSAIELLGVNQYEMCIGGQQQHQLKDKIIKAGGQVNILAEGSYGSVYFVRLPNNHDFVIKEAKLTDRDLTYIHVHNGTKVYQPGQNLNVVEYPEEFLLSDFAKAMILKGICPNFSYIYKTYLCKKDASELWSVTLMESADLDMSAVKDELTEEALWSILYQLLIAVHAMHSVCGIYHRDIKKQNVLIKRIEQPVGGYFRYRVQNDLMNNTFYVKNTGYFAMISDFGSAQTFKPSVVNNALALEDCGTRNAKLVKNQSGDIAFEPITSAIQFVPPPKDPTQDGTYQTPVKVNWEEGDQSTINRVFTRNGVAYPTLDKIDDLNDMTHYPAFEFFNDIMDVLHMFNGGPRMLFADENYNHTKIKNVPKEMVQKIESLGLNGRNIATYSKTKTVKLVVACEMLKYMQREQDKNLVIDEIVLASTIKPFV